MILLEETEGYRVALIPFARLDDNSTRAYLVAFRPGDEWKFILVNREYFKQILQTENPADFTQDKTFYAIAFLWLDEMLFGNTDTDIEEWLLDNGSRAPELTSQNQIETRCIVNHVVIWRCYRIIRAIRHPENPIDFRSPCTDGEILQGFIATFVNCGGSSGGGSSGSLFNPSSNWFGGGEGTGMGSGTFGGFGAGPSVFNHPYLAPIFSHCSLVEQAANGENAANITFTEQDVQSCGQLMTIVSELMVTPDHLALLLQNHPGAFSAVATYLSTSGITALERQALAAYVALLVSGKTTLPLREFMPLYQLVYGQLVPALGLNEQEAGLLLLVGLNGNFKLHWPSSYANSVASINASQNIGLIGWINDDKTSSGVPKVYYNIYGDNGTTIFMDGRWTHTRINYQLDMDEYFMYVEEIERWVPFDPNPTQANQMNIWQAIIDILVENGHSFLDLVGLVPVAGEIADGINALWYLAEGDVTNASLSSLSMVPVFGIASTGVKWTRNALKLKKLTGTAGDVWISPKGLKYLPRSSGQDRLSHVFEHVRNTTHYPNGSVKPIHGVFDDPNDVVGIIDEAWEKVLANSADVVTIPQPGGRTAYVVNMHKRVGWEGGASGMGPSTGLTKVRIVIESGTTDNVVTAFPVL